MTKYERAKRAVAQFVGERVELMRLACELDTQNDPPPIAVRWTKETGYTHTHDFRVFPPYSYKQVTQVPLSPTWPPIFIKEQSP